MKKQLTKYISPVSLETHLAIFYTLNKFEKERMCQLIQEWTM